MGELCTHVALRDLAPEENIPLPPQPLRPRQTVQWESLLRPLELTDLGQEGTDNPAPHRHLCDVVASLTACDSHLAIAREAATTGRPSLLAWTGRRVGLHNVDGQGRSALMIAATNNKPFTAAAAAAFCDFDQQHGAHGTALHMAAYVGASAAALQLCRIGVPLEALNQSFRQTPLHVASSRNHAGVVQVLLDARCSPAALDKHGFNVLRLARYMGSSDSERVLLNHVPDP